MERERKEKEAERHSGGCMCWHDEEERKEKMFRRNRLSHPTWWSGPHFPSDEHQSQYHSPPIQRFPSSFTHHHRRLVSQVKFFFCLVTYLCTWIQNFPCVKARQQLNAPEDTECIPCKNSTEMMRCAWKPMLTASFSLAMSASRMVYE